VNQGNNIIRHGDTTQATFGLPTNLTERANDVHARNIAAGWWKQEQLVPGSGAVHNPMVTIPRNVGELLCLVHSEISEGFEGDVLALPDDKLPHRAMLEVEMADVVIRVLDMLGYYKIDADLLFDVVLANDRGIFPPCTTLNEVHYCYMHRSVSRAMEGFRKGNEDKGIRNLVTLLVQIDHFAKLRRFDLVGAIDEKLEFNANRPDHKLEARAAAGGKQF